MGEEDVRRQKLNVFKMRAMGTEVFPVKSGSRTLSDAINEAMRDWMATRRGHALHHRQRRRPAPVPDDGPRLPVGHRHRRRSSSACEQIGRLPDVVVACVGGGSNAAGMFYPFVDDASRRAGRRRGRRPRHQPRASTRPRSATASPACCTAASATSCRTTTARPPRPFRLGRARLPRRRPGAQLLEGQRPGAVHAASRDEEALERFHLCCRLEGILPALETAHAVVEAMRDRGQAAEGRRGGGLLLRPRRQGLCRVLRLTTRAMSLSQSRSLCRASHPGRPEALLLVVHQAANCAGSVLPRTT